MKSTLFVLCAFLLAACVPASPNQVESSNSAKSRSTDSSALPDLGAAPELTNEIWLNTTKPLRLADLRGQVVLLDMWTFG